MSTAPEMDEAKRLTALERSGLMDSGAEPEFDELVEMAAAICEVPMSLVTLLDEHRQWFKAAIGMQVTETSREVAFCSHTIQQAGVMLVEDATRDPRFCDNPLVTGDMHLRFYAGVPVSDPAGHPLGSLCVLDRVPRTLTEGQLMALRVLGKQANARLELREQRRALEAALAAAEAAREELAASEGRFKTFMNSAPFASFLKDEHDRYLFYNDAFCRHFEITPEAWLGKRPDEVFPNDLARTYRENDEQALRSGHLNVAEEWVPAADGTRSLWRSYLFPCGDAAQRMMGGISVDLTVEDSQRKELQRYQRELEAANARLRELATTDALTGLANRRAFDERLAREFALTQRSGRPLTVMMLDVDNFKQRNDVFGHEEGDASLRQLAALLARAVRATDLAARYGGEEFVLLLADTTEEQAHHLGERLLHAVRAHPWNGARMTVSGGIAALRGGMATTQDLLGAADAALYAAKRAGKDRVVASAAA
jgi:diguanylate cyclase (GGDEF)-like protein/PAS domain S-box-containing protein